MNDNERAALVEPAHSKLFIKENVALEDKFKALELRVKENERALTTLRLLQPELFEF